HPGPGSPVRKALLEAIRAKLNEAVEFKVARLTVVGDWAYFEGQEHKASGRPVGALLRRTDGVWSAEEVVTGDASQPEAIDKFRARLQHDTGRKLPPDLLDR
ncbi:MAG TPA: hypothetical protein VNO55_15235, partial [Polyangia bacterium]|nr:hypothetical protein [Polyangia bacterium]